MDYEAFFAELDTCVPDSQFHPLNVIDIRTRPKSIFTVPDMRSQNSINHLTDELIHQPISEPYSCSTSYYTLVTQDSAHTTWHQDYSASSVFYTVLAFLSEIQQCFRIGIRFPRHVFKNLVLFSAFVLGAIEFSQCISWKPRQTIIS